jgi:hypothetical protein
MFVLVHSGHLKECIEATLAVHTIRVHDVADISHHADELSYPYIEGNN